jgi:drug/metabolite transporter (DMT)-like permease
MALVLIAAALWGISGTVAQYLFQQQGFSPEWLVVIRLLAAGALLLGIAGIKEKQRIWEIWKNKREVLSLLLFSILGLVTVQYTYFAAIAQSNAATATVLQYLAPVFISGFFAIRNKRWPTAKETAVVCLSVIGTVLLVTHGSLQNLSISGWALFWGLGSAVSLVFYTLHPHKLLAKWGSGIVVGWGMLIGGICFSFIHPPWYFAGQWSLNSLMALIFVIVFGTLIAFYCYLESLKHITATETSLLGCIEPLTAAILSVIWLHISFGVGEWLGTFCIIGTIVILSSAKKRTTGEGIMLKRRIRNFMLNK